MRFAFRIGNHFGFSDGAVEDFQGYGANFGALIDERYPFRLIGFPSYFGATSIPAHSRIAASAARPLSVSTYAPRS